MACQTVLAIETSSCHWVLSCQTSEENQLSTADTKSYVYVWNLASGRLLKIIVWLSDGETYLFHYVAKCAEDRYFLTCWKPVLNQHKPKGSIFLWQSRVNFRHNLIGRTEVEIIERLFFLSLSTSQLYPVNTASIFKQASVWGYKMGPSGRQSKPSVVHPGRHPCGLCLALGPC